MSGKRLVKTLMAGALFALAINVSGCASTVADLPLVGLPADAPARPKEQRAYLPVHDMPAAREQPALTTAEQAKLQAELAAARDRQAAAAAGR